jgi:hypothetical protein
MTRTLVIFLGAVGTLGSVACNVPSDLGEITASSSKGPHVEHVLSTGVDQVTDWNQIAHANMATAAGFAPETRTLAIMHAAMFDAVNDIERDYQVYAVDLTAPAGSSPEAAAVAAAHKVLVTLIPASTAAFDAARVTSLAAIPDGQGKTDGIAHGVAVATAMLAMRSGDAVASVPFVPGSHAPGIFDVTGVNSQWGDMAPFALHSVDQYVGGGPYSLTSAEYAADFNEVKSLGRATSITRTADQTHAALWWVENSNFTWNRIARIAAAARGNSLNENARLFALLNIAAADAIITGFRTKYTYVSWRPIKAIARADEDNNSATDADPSWVPLALTPAHPDYLSNHGVYSAAAAQVLADFFGDNFSFSTGSSSAVPAGTTREFGSFSEAAAECGESRIWLGYHTRKAVEDALKSGRQIGHFTFEHIARMKNGND